MQRREFLGVAGAASVWLAGCLGDDGAGADGTDTSETITDTPTGTATRTPTATDRPTSTTTTTASETTTAETDATTTTETASETPPPTATPTATATATATGTDAPATDATTRPNPPASNDGTMDSDIAVENRTFAVENRTAGGSEMPGGVTGTDDAGGDEASVRFDPAANRVVVTGTIVGENGCQTATLESVSYDADAGVLTVTVGTERDAPEDAMCSMALVELPYEATITFEDGLPERVSVVHRGVETDGEIATAARES